MNPVNPLNPRKDGLYGTSRSRLDTDFPDASTSYDAPSLGASLGAGDAPGDLKSSRGALYDPPKSTVDRHSSFDGKYESESDLQVQGTLSGEIACRGTLTIDAEATVKALVQAAAASIYGMYEGDLVCAGKLVIGSTARVSGTVKAGVLVIEEGATVQATVDTTAGAAANAAISDSKRKENGAGPTSIARATRREPSFAMVTPAAEDRPALERP